MVRPKEERGASQPKKRRETLVRPDEKRPILRDGAGRYLPGTRPGPGLPKNYGAQEKIEAEMLVSECSLRDATRRVFLDLADRALRGDRSARRSVLKFVARCRQEDELLAMLTESWAKDAQRILEALDRSDLEGVLG